MPEKFLLAISERDAGCIWGDQTFENLEAALGAATKLVIALAAAGFTETDILGRSVVASKEFCISLRVEG